MQWFPNFVIRSIPDVLIISDSALLKYTINIVCSSKIQFLYRMVWIFLRAISTKFFNITMN